MLAYSSSGGGSLGTLLLIAGVLYFIPSVLAILRGVPNAGSVIVLNLLLGWTLLGWVVSLAMACRSRPQAPPRGHYGPPDPYQYGSPRR